MTRAASIILSALAGSSASALQAVKKTVNGPKGPTRRAKSLDMLKRFIKPALSTLGANNSDAAALLLGTAITESGGFRFINQQGGGPALGLFQVEPATHEDIWVRIFARRWIIDPHFQAYPNLPQNILNLMSVSAVA